MKLLTIFLIAMVLIGSGLPCADSENISFGEAHSLSIPASDDHAESIDSCSAFCICSCCSISQFFESQFSIRSLSYSSSSLIHFQNEYIFNPHLSIWQPPKA